MAAGAGAGLAAVPAAAATAAVKPAISRHHVSPFGTGARRVARNVQRHAAAPGVNTGATLWVSNTTSPGGDTSCADPGYATISAALSAAGSGDTIEVCAGTYDEQLVIKQGVILQAKGPVTVVGPATFPTNPADYPTICDGDGGSQPNQDVVDICGSGTVKITGFTIQGGFPATSGTGYCYDSFYGVAVLGGANLVMSNSTVEDIGNGSSSGSGCQGGVGIQVGLATGGTTADPGTATLNNDVVNVYQKNGITVDGTGSSATINNVTVTGAGATTATAQNGIQISDYATAKINTGSVSGNECDVSVCGPDGFTQTQACGILLYDAGKVLISGTNASANDIGVANVEDVAWTYYTPPSPFVATSEAISGMLLSNRYENGYFDQGKSAISNSTLTGGEAGIETAQYSGQTTPDVTTATGDTFTGATQDAVLQASDNAAGDKAPKLTVSKSSFDTTNAGGIANQSYSVVAATGNYWGDPTGPSVWSFGKGSSVSADVNFFPWYTDSGMTTPETCLTGPSETSTTTDQVLCAPSDGSNAFLANGGTGDVLLIGNGGNDQLFGTTAAGGETWIISGTGGTNTINGKGGTGYIQKRGNGKDTITNAANYIKALR